MSRVRGVVRDIQVQLRIVPRELDPREGLAFQGVLGKSRQARYVGGEMYVIGVGSMPLLGGCLSVGFKGRYSLCLGGWGVCVA
jgi:hypothetical protein